MVRAREKRRDAPPDIPSIGERWGRNAACFPMQSGGWVADDAEAWRTAESSGKGLERGNERNQLGQSNRFMWIGERCKVCHRVSGTRVSGGPGKDHTGGSGRASAVSSQSQSAYDDWT